ncbi:Probable E3 ubiquitin-protein ligase RNF217 (RING finger protein 217) [Durusdinium trenchii]|uniref:RBR-type E3 ubiquitin transferase n=1 Tax=Durusdinium trenchii TaxID=1381693 RepID=A0ABP0QT27_9DINO
MARHDEELPLLASPAPHIEALGASPQPGAQRGIDRSAAQLAWKKLLVNSPPAWAQSPDLLGSRRGEPQLESRIPPFPAWPSSSTTWPFETPSLSQDDEDEIARFLSHCTSFDELLRSTPRAPTATPERRVGAASRLSDQVWSPQQMTGAKPQRSRPSEASTATPPEHHAETSQGFAKLPDTEEVQVPMGSCRGCQRRFRANRLPIHEEICLRNAQKKRSVFESSRQRCEAVTGRWWSDSELRGSQQPNSQWGRPVGGGAEDVVVAEFRQNSNPELDEEPLTLLGEDASSSVSLVVHIHPDLAQKLLLRVEVTAETPVTEGDPKGGYAEAPNVMEMARRKVAGSAAPAKPALEAELQHLPPLRLQLKLPADYPSSSPPTFQLASSWLDVDVLSALRLQFVPQVLCESLDQKWLEAALWLRFVQEGSPIIFTWAEALRYEVPEAIGTGPVVLRDGSDQRARSECTSEPRHGCGVEQGVSPFAGALADHRELLCPEPSCRADFSSQALAEVLEDSRKKKSNLEETMEEQYERWHGLKLQRVLVSELEGVVFCPRCEEGGRETPVLPDEAVENEPPVARCGRCEYVFCSKCSGLYHGRDPCLHPEERAQQAAMRRLQGACGVAEKRKLQREATKGYLVCVSEGDDRGGVRIRTGIREEHSLEHDPILAGDSVKAVHAGVPERITASTLWEAQRDNICNLGQVLLESPRTGGRRAGVRGEPRDAFGVRGATLRPISIRFRRGNATQAANRLKERRLMEELLTLKEIARESQVCPNCHVRVQRSAGCNHMTCTRCRTHFCYRCGKKLDPEMPYNHFSATGCTTFDTEEVRRMAMQQRDRQGQGFIDVELERLREEFGEQRDLFAQFERQRPGVPERAVRLGRRNIADRLRNGEVQCPSCGQWNGRVGGLNHIRCGMCRGSYCGHCRRRGQSELLVPRDPTPNTPCMVSTHESTLGLFWNVFWGSMW